MKQEQQLSRMQTIFDQSVISKEEQTDISNGVCHALMQRIQAGEYPTTFTELLHKNKELIDRRIAGDPITINETIVDFKKMWLVYGKNKSLVVSTIAKILHVRLSKVLNNKYQDSNLFVVFAGEIFDEYVITPQIRVNICGVDLILYCKMLVHNELGKIYSGNWSAIDLLETWAVYMAKRNQGLQNAIQIEEHNVKSKPPLKAINYQALIETAKVNAERRERMNTNPAINTKAIDFEQEI